VQRRSPGSIVASELPGRLSISGAAFGSAVILANAAIGQPIWSWIALGITLFILWQFRGPRVFRGAAGEPELLPVILSTEQSFTCRRRS